MVKDPIFFTPEVDYSMNIINETDREEHSRMRRMLSFAFSNSNLFANEAILVRRTDEFISQIGQMPTGGNGFNIVKQFNYVTFNIMGIHTDSICGIELIKSSVFRGNVIR
jgi:cytochrome P450